jgi:hypothetical protein
MISLTQIKQRVLFWKDWYPTRAVVLRRRGDTFVPEFTAAVRMHYDDRPNLHKLKTGEETKAVDLEAVSQATDGRSTIFLCEAEDGQLLPWYPEFDEDKIESLLISNLDERLNAHMTHREKAEEKYTVPGFFNENKHMIMTVVTALSVAIIIFAVGQQFGDAVPYLKALSESMPDVANALQQSGSPPPGN